MTRPPWRALVLLVFVALTTLACRLAQEAVGSDDNGTPAVLLTAESNEVLRATPTRRGTPPPRSTSPAFNTGSPVQDAYLAMDEAGRMPSDVFGQGDPIYLYGTLAAPEGVNLRTAWVAVDAEGNQPETLIYEFPDQSYTSGNFWFRLEWPRPWAFGRYRVDLYLDGVLDRSIEYEVAQTNTTGARLESPFMSLDEAATEVTDLFGEGDSFHIHFNLAGAGPDTPVRVVWVARQVEGLEPNSYVNEYLSLMNDGPNWVSIRQAQPWGRGDYQADLYVRGQLAQSLFFRVDSTNTTNAVIEGAFTARDEAGADTTDTFDTNESVYLHFSMPDAPDNTAITASMALVNENGVHTFIDKYRDVFSSGDYYIFFAPQDAWTPGSYVIYLYVNGDLSRQLNITIQ